MSYKLTLNHRQSVTLHHDGACYLRGLRPDGTVFVEEIYGDDDWIAQHAIDADGSVVNTIDEDYGRGAEPTLMPLPADAVRPAAIMQARGLNFSGARRRGLRATDRVGDVARGLSIPAKMRLVEYLKLNIPAPMLLGVAESVVLAEAVLTPDILLVCRRVRLVHAMSSPRKDRDGQPYDYDSRELHIAHLYDPSEDEQDVPMERALAGVGGVALHMPMDCLAAHGQLVIADGGADSTLSRVHVWDIS